MNYQYLDANNQPAGPVSLDEIRALVASGTLPPDPQVAPEGSTEWRSLSALTAAAPQASATSSVPPPSAGSPAGVAGPAASAPAETAAKKPLPLPSSTILADLVGKVLDYVTRGLSPALIERTLAFSVRIGHYAVLVGGAISLLYAIYAAIKYNSFTLFLAGLGFVAALAVAQFAAQRFLGAGDRTIRSTPSRIGSPAFLECLGLLVILAAAAMLISGIGTAIRIESFVPLVPAIIGAAILTCFGALALHPSLVNVSVADGSSGEEAIGLISFFFKSMLKLVPLFFFLIVVAGGLAVIASFFDSGQAFARTIVQLFALPLPLNLPYGLAGAGVILSGCLFPILAYFVYLIWYLVLDILRAILCIPAKLDALRGRL